MRKNTRGCRWVKTVAIVGLGTITKYYLKGIADAPLLRLSAVCDIAEQAPSRPLFSAVPFYQDYKAMLQEVRPDYLVISTPPASHMEIATYALENGTNVIVEKPATLCMEDYDALIALAREKGLLFEVAFHWQNGSEVLEFNRLYDPAQISEVTVCVLDPYSADGVVIDEQKRKLMGAWVDSGINALSLLKMWLPFESVEVCSANAQLCPESGLPVYADVQLVIDGVPVRITVDWRKGQNKKESFLTYQGRRIHLNHSGQCIVDGGKAVDCEHMERLQQHYYQYFTAFDGTADVPAARKIHEVLFKVRDML